MSSRRSRASGAGSPLLDERHPATRPAGPRTTPDGRARRDGSRTPCSAITSPDCCASAPGHQRATYQWPSSDCPSPTTCAWPRPSAVRSACRSTGRSILVAGRSRTARRRAPAAAASRPRVARPSSVDLRGGGAALDRHRLGPAGRHRRRARRAPRSTTITSSTWRPPMRDADLARRAHRAALPARLPRPLRDLRRRPEPRPVARPRRRRHRPAAGRPGRACATACRDRSPVHATGSPEGAT